MHDRNHTSKVAKVDFTFGQATAYTDSVTKPDAIAAARVSISHSEGRDDNEKKAEINIRGR